MHKLDGRQQKFRDFQRNLNAKCLNVKANMEALGEYLDLEVIEEN